MGKCSSVPPPPSYPISINFLPDKNLEILPNTITLHVNDRNRISDIIYKLKSYHGNKLKHKYLNINKLQLYKSERMEILDRTKTLKYHEIRAYSILSAGYPKIEPFGKYHTDISLVDVNDVKFKCIKDAFNKDMKEYNAELLDIYKIDRNYDINNNIFDAILRTKQNKEWNHLYHGTSFNNVAKIIYNGFNRDYNRRSAYGYGTYLAASPATACYYCSKYSPDIAIYSMLVCKTIIGETGTYKGFQKDGITEYDSLVNNTRDPKIFVINRDYHTIPQYILIFKYK